MFESLEEHIRHDDQAEATPSERALRYFVITAVSVMSVVAIFGAIHFVK